MNIKKLFYHQLKLSALIFIVFSLTLSRSQKPVTDNWLNALIYLVMLWAVYYFAFIRTPKDDKLDEREMTIYVRTGHLSAFVFMSVLLLVYFLQNHNVPLFGTDLGLLWGWFMLPVYILLHSLTGLVLFYFENK